MPQSFLVLLVLLLGFLALFRWAAFQNWVATRIRLLAGVAIALCLLLAALPLAGGLFAARIGQMVFHDEPSVLATAAAFLHGQPLYPSSTYPAEYALLYGPATYFVYLPPMLAGAGLVENFQIWLVLALVATLVFFFLALRPLHRSASFFAIALLAIFLCRSDHIFTIKGDLWEVLFAALALWAALQWSPWLAALAIGFSGAMLVNLKATTVLIALLPLLLLSQRGRRCRQAALFGLVLMLLFAPLPFLSPQISLLSYLQQLHEATQHGFSRTLFLVNLYFALWLSLPALALLWLLQHHDAVALRRYLHSRRTYLALLLLTGILAILTGSKNGAGPWHLMGLFVPVLFVTTELWVLAASRLPTASLFSRHSAPLFAVLLVLALSSVLYLTAELRRMQHGPPESVAAQPRAVEQDILNLIQQHPNASLQMGYSDLADYNLTFLRPLLQEHGSPLFIDADARNEADLIGLPVSPQVIQRLKSCSIDLWLLPKGGEPFSMPSPYSLDPALRRKIVFTALYPEDFRQAFLATYQQVPSQSSYFNLWACRNPPSHP